jgi:hypothetical protein
MCKSGNVCNMKLFTVNTTIICTFYITYDKSLTDILQFVILNILKLVRFEVLMAIINMLL